MTNRYKGKCTKAGFETRIVQLFDAQDLSVRNYNEHGTKLKLYYYKDVHIGTYQVADKEGWIFDEETVERGFKSMCKMKKTLAQ